MGVCQPIILLNLYLKLHENERIFYQEGRCASLASPLDQAMQDRHGRRAVRCNACIPSTGFPDPPLMTSCRLDPVVLHLLLLFTQ